MNSDTQVEANAVPMPAGGRVLHPRAKYPGTDGSTPGVPHVHAKLMKAYAILAGLSSQPWVYFECLPIGSSDWTVCGSNITWSQNTSYRLRVPHTTESDLTREEVPCAAPGTPVPPMPAVMVMVVGDGVRYRLRVPVGDRSLIDPVAETVIGRILDAVN